MLRFCHPLDKIMSELLIFNIRHFLVSILVLGVVNSGNDIANGTWFPLISFLGTSFCRLSLFVPAHINQGFSSASVFGECLRSIKFRTISDDICHRLVMPHLALSWGRRLLSIPFPEGLTVIKICLVFNHVLLGVIKSV
jgi:hypothetical protein